MGRFYHDTIKTNVNNFYHKNSGHEFSNEAFHLFSKLETAFNII